MISFILSYREQDSYRRRNLLYTIERLKKLNIESEIIVVEENKKNNIQDIKDIKPFFIYSNNLFNKSKCYNVGVLNAKYDILCFHDIDLFLYDNTFFKSIELLKKYDVVDPYNKIFYLNNDETNNFIKSNKYNNYINMIESRVVSGGCFFQNKNKYIGFNEKCVGYGYEDDLYDVKLYKNNQKVCKIMNSECVHLWHPIRENVQNNNLSLLLKENIILWKINWITKINN